MRTPRRRRPGLLSEPGRGFCQYLPLFTQHPYLAAQPIEFFALGRGQAVAAQSFIESSLLDPLADRLNCRFEFTRQRGDAAPAARQFNDSTPVFCCVWWMRSGHLENSFSLSPTPSTKLGQLHERSYVSALFAPSYPTKDVAIVRSHQETPASPVSRNAPATALRIDAAHRLARLPESGRLRRKI